jgi:hypothetical protein
MNEDSDLINTPLQWGVLPSEWRSNRFSGFRRPVKTAEAVRGVLRLRVTPLKWGVNETHPPICPAMVKDADQPTATLAQA